MPARAGATHQRQNEVPHGKIHIRDKTDFHGAL
jgi:hypothetical protein